MAARKKLPIITDMLIDKRLAKTFEAAFLFEHLFEQKEFNQILKLLNQGIGFDDPISMIQIFRENEQLSNHIMKSPHNKFTPNDLKILLPSACLLNDGGKILKIILDQLKDIREFKNAAGSTLLHIIAEPSKFNKPFILFNYTQILELLIRHHVDLNAVDKKQCTALAYACEDPRKFELACELINRNVELDIQDIKKSTALHKALRNGNRQVALRLLKKGANPELEDEDGITALDIINEKGYH
jgi:ankyrin repeat protein